MSLLDVKNLSIRFGGLKAVDDVTMNIEAGEIFGIIGPNGAGKTTFFNMCSGVYRPTAGEVYFEGTNLVGKKPEEICRLGLARTFQNIKLFNYMTVLDNVKIGFHTKTKTHMFDAIARNKRFREDEKLIHERGLELLHMLRLEEQQDTKAGNLSYGMQRKVEIARALATDPKLLMLDEPAAGMNAHESRELSNFIKLINSQGYTVALIEHDMKFVMSTCERIMVLNFGKKIAEGEPEMIKNDPEVAEAYFGKGFIERKEA